MTNTLADYELQLNKFKRKSANSFMTLGTRRHFGTFTGSFEGRQGHREVVEMFGLCRVVVNDDLKISKIEVFFDPVKV